MDLERLYEEVHTELYHDELDRLEKLFDPMINMASPTYIDDKDDRFALFDWITDAATTHADKEAPQVVDDYDS